jgi:hypothetical protein
MAAALACAFPLALIAAVLILFPLREPERPAGTAARVDRRPFSSGQIYRGAFVLLVVSLMAALAVSEAQRALFARTHAGDLLFQYRLVDARAYPYLPGLLVGLAVAPPVLWALLRWYFGDRLVDLLDRLDRRPTPRPLLRRELRVARRQVWPVGILATLLNVAALDTFLEVGSRELRVSSFLDATTHRHPTADVAELVVYSQRRAPTGGIVPNANLEIRLRDGSSIDTYRIIDPRHVPEVIEALRRSEGFTGTVRTAPHPALSPGGRGGG